MPECWPGLVVALRSSPNLHLSGSTSFSQTLPRESALSKIVFPPAKILFKMLEPSMDAMWCILASGGLRLGEI